MLDTFPGSSSTLEKGAFLWHEGEASTWVALLEKGELEVLRYSADGECAILNVIKTPQLLGEMSALDGSTHSASVRARTSCVIKRCATEDFVEWAQSEGRWRVLMAEQSKRLRALSARYVENSLDSVRTRLIRTLLDESEGFLAVTHQQLAERLGTTRESVSKSLGELSRAGLVSVTRGRISVLDSGALRAIASEPR
ncbi:unnamed protein product [Phaeothamnion confervicola]